MEVSPYSGWKLDHVRILEDDSDSRVERIDDLPGSSVVDGERIDLVIESVLKGYRDGGYLLSRVEDVSLEPDSTSRSVELSLLVDRGPRCSISSISLVGNRSLDEETFTGLTSLTVGSPLNENELQEGLERVVVWYRDNGYPNAAVELEGFSVDQEGRVDLGLVCREGKRVRIGDISVLGNHVTRKEVVLRQLGIKPGDSFSMAEIDDGRERLQESSLYDDVGEITLLKNSNPYKVDLEIAVEEGKTNSFSGVAGLVPGTGGKIRPTGLLHLVLGNLWGTARRIEIRWMGRGEGNSQLDIDYREPWIAGSPLSAEFRFTQELRDTSFSRVEFSFAGVGPVGEGFEGQLGFEHQSIFSVFESESSGDRNSRVSLLAGVRRLLTPSLLTDRRWGMSLELLLGQRGINGVKYGEMEGRGWLSAIVWGGLKRDLRITAGGRFIDSPLRPIPGYHLFSLGGTETVRGYAEDRVWGNRAIWQRAELGFRLSRDSRYLLFYDLGIVDITGSGNKSRILQGYGTGVRLASSIGLMKIDYAMRPGLSPLEGRIHVGWSQGF
jgi:outer membrane protein insertion porin family